MKTFLLHLLLASLLLALVHCQADFPQFKIMHTYNKRQPFSCTHTMNRVLRRLHLPCKPCNSFILGDNVDFTQINDVINICNGEGSSVGPNTFRSNRFFRTVKCWQVGSGGHPDDCLYTDQYMSSQIIVGCSQNRPVHFETC